jgi:TatD DNase family protein
MTYIDSHAHLTSSKAFDEVDLILERAQAAGISTIVNICTDVQSLERGLALSKQYPWIYHTAAITPHDVDQEGEAQFPLIAEHARKGDLVAIGETGLDYYYEHSSREMQKHFLKKYLALALECQLPIVIHCREAFEDLFAILDADYQVGNRCAPGVLHCFTGTLSDAQGVLERGWYLSLSGIVTFKKSLTLQEIAKKIPLSQLLIETDTPYLAPQSQRGKPNEPAYLPEIAAFIATLKGISAEEVAEATAQNARLLFNLERSPH